MRRLWGRPEQPAVTSSPRPVVLTPKQLLERLPATARQSVEHWPLGDVPLAPGARDRLVQVVSEDLVRVTGVILPFGDMEEGEQEIGFRIGTGQGRMAINLNVGDALPYAQLRGMYADVAVGNVTREAEHLCTASLQEIHGIEQPLRNGDPQGIARGVVRAIHQHATVGEPAPNGLTLASGDEEIHVAWNYSRAPALQKYDLLEPGAIIALGVETQGDHYMWHPNNLEFGRHYLIQPAVPEA